MVAAMKLDPSDPILSRDAEQIRCRLENSE